MQRTILLASLFIGVSVVNAGTKVTIVIGSEAPPLEKLAAKEVAGDLAALFDANTTIQATLPADASPAVLIGSPATNPAIPADVWPKLSDQGHVLRSTGKGLIVGGGSPAATLWAASELAYHFGVRHLLHGDVMPIVRPAMKFDGLDVVLEPAVRVRAWNAFNEHAHSALSWPLEEHERLVAQLAKLKFTHLVVPAKLTPFTAIAVDGDTGGRAAFKGARTFQAPDDSAILQHIEKAAGARGITVVREIPAGVTPIALGASPASILPEFSPTRLAADFQAMLSTKPTGFVATAVMPGDLNAAAHFVSRASFATKLTAQQALEELVTPICGDGVAERLWKGFQQVGQAAALIAANDASLGVPDASMLLRHLESREPPPAWLTEVKTLYTGAMSEMYRGNTRARGGARPFILYHAKRLEFAMHFCTAIESLKKAGSAKASNDADARAEASEQALEAVYNALNAHADVARDASDRGVIALLNEHGYRPLAKALEEQ